MISEERLKELVDNKKEIWIVDNDRVSSIKLTVLRYGVSVDEYNKTNNCEPMLYCDFCGIYTDICPISQAFETEEDAREYQKYGNVMRTEKFPYVSWEEFCKCDKTIKFFNKEIEYSMYVFVKNKNTNNCRIIIYADDREQDWIVFEQPLTRENYHKALDFAIRLWKGEE